MEGDIDKFQQGDLLGNVLREIDAISIPEGLADPKTIEEIIRSLAEIDRTAQRVVVEKDGDIDPRVSELNAKLLAIKEKIFAAIDIIWKKIETADPASFEAPHVPQEAIFEYLRTLKEVTQSICEALSINFLPPPSPEVIEPEKPTTSELSHEPEEPLPEPTTTDKFKRWLRNIF